MEDKIPEIIENHPALPREMPELTYWPLTAALGMFFLLFGILTSLIVSAVGFVLMIIAFTGWIFNVEHDFEPEIHERGREDRQA